VLGVGLGQSFFCEQLKTPLDLRYDPHPFVLDESKLGVVDRYIAMVVAPTAPCDVQPAGPYNRPAVEVHKALLALRGLCRKPRMPSLGDRESGQAA
jgi:hypothetical protein